LDFGARGFTMFAPSFAVSFFLLLSSCFYFNRKGAKVSRSSRRYKFAKSSGSWPA
jgi:hypothetical protein